MDKIKTRIECIDGYYYEDGIVTLEQARKTQSAEIKKELGEPQYVETETVGK